MIKFRIRRIGVEKYFNPRSMNRWVYAVLALATITVLWFIYFFVTGISNSGDIHVVGRVIYGDRAIANVRVVLGEDETFTDEKGEFSFANLDFGRGHILVSKDQFVERDVSMVFWKKEHNLNFIEIKRDSRYTGFFSGFVVNNFDQRPIANAMVVLDGVSQYTNDQGAFAFQEAGVGDMVLKVSAVGFFDFEETVTVEQEQKEHRQISLSPYGKISFTSSRGGKRSIYSVNYDGTLVKNITGKYAGESWGGQFTKDGRRLVFYGDIEDESTNEWGQKVSNIYSVDSNGEGLTKINQEGVSPYGNFVTSDDGKSVLMLGKTSASNAPEIYLAGIGEDDSWLQVTDNDVFESDIGISPDGHRAVYTAFKDGSRDIFIISLANLVEEQITQTDSYESAPQFSPDGNYLLFLRDGIDFSSRIIVMDLRTRAEKEIYKTSLKLKNIRWSNDGEKIVFTSERDGKNTMAIISRKGGEETKLAEGIGDCRYVIWPNLQKIIAFSTRTDDGDKLVVMDVALRKMTELENVESDVISWAER